MFPGGMSQDDNARDVQNTFGTDGYEIDWAQVLNSSSDTFLHFHQPTGTNQLLHVTQPEPSLEQYLKGLFFQQPAQQGQGDPDFEKVTFDYNLSSPTPVTVEEVKQCYFGLRRLCLGEWPRHMDQLFKKQLEDGFVEQYPRIIRQAKENIEGELGVRLPDEVVAKKAAKVAGEVDFCADAPTQRAEGGIYESIE